MFSLKKVLSVGVLIIASIAASPLRAQTAVTRETLPVETEATQAAQPLPSTQQAAKDAGVPVSSSLQPFGANLFKGRFTSQTTDGLNPEYIIQQGDKIALRIWGAVSVEQDVTVDGQGNIFVPDVGPIHVVGIRNAELNGRIRTALKRVYTQNVNVYTNLQAPTPVLVFVTGFVNRPGSYAGIASDSLLYFLDSAGGIDSERGSFRDIRILRNGAEIARADLYDFLLHGNIPRPQFADGDTIVVGKRGESIAVGGAVRNNFKFEIPAGGILGKDVIEFARPQANALYATVTGTREDGPYAIYVTLSELATMTLYDGDDVIFEVDQSPETMIVNVQGSHLGPSRFVVPRGTHLLELLNFIQVDPELADIDSISLHRESIKIRQKQAIEDTLKRLQAAVLSKRSITQEGADIQVKQAELINNFVERARNVEPEGILVVAHDDHISDILLQPNDVIVIPEKTNVVQVSGEVSVPQALVYVPGANMSDYILKVGGYTERADKKRHLILRRTGEVVPLFDGKQNIAIRPGDEIIALPEIPGIGIELVQLITETMFRITSSAAIFLRL